MQNILRVMKYEPNLHQTVMCHLHLPRWFPSTPFPAAQKALEFPWDNSPSQIPEKSALVLHMETLNCRGT